MHFFAAFVPFVCRHQGNVNAWLCEDFVDEI